jgi:rRNA-processing protein FCF1
MALKNVRSISFDTSFLLRPSTTIDRIIKNLRRDRVPCFITTTVVSELEQLKVWGRISEAEYVLAMSRWKRTNARVIDFKNHVYSSLLNQECVASMGEEHGVSKRDIANDCNIIVTALKNGVDFFLSEDYHFTSKVTEAVLAKMESNACTEYRQICGQELYSLNSTTFVMAYRHGKMDMDIVASERRDVRKPGKTLER